VPGLVKRDPVELGILQRIVGPFRHRLGAERVEPILPNANPSERPPTVHSRKGGTCRCREVMGEVRHSAERFPAVESSIGYIDGVGRRIKILTPGAGQMRDSPVLHGAVRGGLERFQIRLATPESCGDD
jgi:hypothetical protein